MKKFLFLNLQQTNSDYYLPQKIKNKNKLDFGQQKYGNKYIKINKNNFIWI